MTETTFNRQHMAPVMGRTRMWMLRIAAIAVIAAFGLVAACGDDEGEAADTKTVETVMGPVEAPVDPQRIVAVNYQNSVQWLAELEAPLVGVQTRTDGTWDALPGSVQDVPSIWVRGTDIDFEAIIAVEPDLIVGLGENEDIYQQLSDIAPTVLVDGDLVWTDAFRFVGDVVNRTEKADELIQGVETRIADLNEAVDERWPDGVDLTMLRVRDDIRTYAVAERVNRSGMWLLNQVDGLTVTGDARNAESDRLSPEQLRQADGDVIIYYPGGGGSDASEEDDFLLNILNNPLWDSLSAVQADRAHRVSSDVWFDGAGVTAFNLAVDDLMEYVVEAP